MLNFVLKYLFESLDQFLGKLGDRKLQVVSDSLHNEVQIVTNFAFVFDLMSSAVVSGRKKLFNELKKLNGRFVLHG